MREKRDFAKRSGVKDSREVLKKFFLVYEGKNTEDIYFDGIADYRKEIGINPLIELVPVVRSYSEEGWSNPKVSAHRRYTEQELRKLLPGYSKSRYPMEQLLGNIGRAIQNEKSFCEDEEELEHSIGSRVGLLIEELK